MARGPGFFNFLCISCVLALVSTNNEAEGDIVSVTFKPGKIGLGASWESGRVTRVDRGGQAASAGVEVGWQMVQIDEESYSEALLDKKIAGKKQYKLSFNRPPPPPLKVDPDFPPKPDFAFAMELDPESYEEKVMQVTNQSGFASPPYFPVVMFHMSWCKHCRHALPEFEQAAEKVHNAVLSNSFEGYKAIPKFFLLECDLSSEHRAICDQHTETRYPAIRMFRDSRAIEFNRPRIADVFASWASRVARPPIMMMMEMSQLEAASRHQTIFILCADPAKDLAAVKAWEQVALDKLDTHSLLLVTPDSQAGQSLGPSLSVTARGPGIKPLPFVEEVTYEKLAEWVNFNQFLEIEQLSPYTGHHLKSSQLDVVVLAYSSKDSTHQKVLDSFVAKAKHLRQSGKKIFATVDVSSADDAEYLEAIFPLVAPSRARYPQVFALAGADRYWEQPGLVDPSSLSAESIDALLASAEALQDGSVWSMIKDRRKRIVRYASGSAVGLAVTVLGPLLLLVAGRSGVRSLLADDEAPTAEQKGAKAE